MGSVLSAETACCLFCRNTFFDCDLIKASLATVRSDFLKAFAVVFRCDVVCFQTDFDVLVVAGAFGPHLSAWVLS